LAGPYRLLCYDNYLSHPTRPITYTQKEQSNPRPSHGPLYTIHKILSLDWNLETASPLHILYTTSFHFPSPSPYPICVLRHQRPFIKTLSSHTSSLGLFWTDQSRSFHTLPLRYPESIELALIRSCLRLHLDSHSIRPACHILLLPLDVRYLSTYRRRKIQWSTLLPTLAR